MLDSVLCMRVYLMDTRECQQFSTSPMSHAVGQLAASSEAGLIDSAAKSAFLTIFITES